MQIFYHLIVHLKTLLLKVKEKKKILIIIALKKIIFQLKISILIIFQIIHQKLKMLI